MGKQWLTLFFLDPKSLQMVIAAIKLKNAYSLKGKYDTVSTVSPSISHEVMEPDAMILVF